MIIGRLISWALIGAAFVVLGHDLLQYLNSETWHSILAGELWFRLNPEGLNLVQAVIQRYVWPALWDPVIVTLLLWPAWLVFLVPGIVLLLLFRKRRKAERRGYSA
ncbi:hypothetical protein GQF03_18490 [Sneathiella chungangensis]|uniref:Uncharacterized protein n=1 Tax=Sneathiella chungangensis TaxID=1418234 RepID=A0A845MKQ3_9PROT|nr:hypothetical protein [Sneathiella chungangensis]MZR24329.1 hypothetical protein [Sneathiella chungangensis]